MRHPAHDPGVVLDPFVGQHAAAGNPVPLGHAERQVEAPPAVVRMPGEPVDGVLEHVAGGVAQALHQLRLVGDLQHEALAGGDRTRQQHVEHRVVQVLVEAPVVGLLHVVDLLAGDCRRLVRAGRLVVRVVRLFRRRAVGVEERHALDVVDVRGQVLAPADVGDVGERRDAQPQAPQRHERLHDQRDAGDGVAVALDRDVDVGARHPRPRAPALPVRDEQTGRQAVVPEAPLVVVPLGGRIDRPLDIRIAGEAADGRGDRCGLEIVEGMEAHPDVGQLPAPIELPDRDLLQVAGLDLDREPVVLASIDLGKEIGALAGVSRESGGGPPGAQQNPCVGVPQPILEQSLAAVLQQVHRSLVLPARPAPAAGSGRLGHQCPQPFVEVAGEPEDEALELLFEEVLVDQLPELLVLHAVGRPGAQRAASEVHRDRRAPADRRDQVEVAALELELEPVDPQPPAADMAGRLRLGFTQLVVQRGGTETGLVVGCPCRAARDHRCRDRGDEARGGFPAEQRGHDPHHTGP